MRCRVMIRDHELERVLEAHTLGRVRTRASAPPRISISTALRSASAASNRTTRPARKQDNGHSDQNDILTEKQPAAESAAQAARESLGAVAKGFVQLCHRGRAPACDFGLPRGLLLFSSYVTLPEFQPRLR